MVHRQIELDDETDRILSKLAENYSGNIGQALAGLVHAHESLEAFVEQCEDAHQETLRNQLERSERGFREGRFTHWDEVKRHNRL